MKRERGNQAPPWHRRRTGSRTLVRKEANLGRSLARSSKVSPFLPREQSEKKQRRGSGSSLK